MLHSQPKSQIVKTKINFTLSTSTHNDNDDRFGIDDKLSVRIAQNIN